MHLPHAYARLVAGADDDSNHVRLHVHPGVDMEYLEAKRDFAELEFLEIQRGFGASGAGLGGAP